MDRWGFDPDPRKQKSRKGSAFLIFSEWARLTITCSHHTTNPVCAPSTATDSHLVIFNTRRIQPEGTNYSSVFIMLQCLQRTVLEKYSYLAWQKKPLKTKERALCDESQVHPKSNRRKQFEKLDRLWWKIVQTRVHFLSGTVQQIGFLCNPKAWLSLKSPNQNTKTTVQNGQGSVSQFWVGNLELSWWNEGALLFLLPSSACLKTSAHQERHYFSSEGAGRLGSQMPLK